MVYIYNITYTSKENNISTLKQNKEKETQVNHDRNRTRKRKLKQVTYFINVLTTDKDLSVSAITKKENKENAKANIHILKE